MSRFYSIPGVSVRNSSDGPQGSLVESLQKNPKFREFYEGRKKRGDDAQVGLPAGTPITLNGEAGVVEGETKTPGGDILTHVRGNKSGTRTVRWGQDKRGEIVVAESRRTHE